VSRWPAGRDEELGEDVASGELWSVAAWVELARG
jgi:hypothetical protein